MKPHRHRHTEILYTSHFTAADKSFVFPSCCFVFVLQIKCLSDCRQHVMAHRTNYLFPQALQKKEKKKEMKREISKSHLFLPLSNYPGSICTVVYYCVACQTKEGEEEAFIFSVFLLLWCCSVGGKGCRNPIWQSSDIF